jgi:hypothetical protein
MARIVGVKRSERRTDRRATTAVRVVLDGETLPVLNWSLGGFVIPYNKLWLEWQCAVAIKLLVPEGSGDVELDLEARVVRQDHEKRQLAGTFLELSSHAFSVLNRYVARKLGGSPQPH